MGSWFYVAPFPPREWKSARVDMQVDPDWLKHELRMKWPLVETYNIPDSSGFSWRFNSQDTTSPEGELQTNLQIVSISHPLPKFVVWYRKIIDPKYDLYVFGTSSWDSLSLFSDTTLSEIESFFMQ